MSETIRLDDLELQLERKPIKHLYLHIGRQTGRLSIRAPLQMPQETILDFVRKKMDWIHKHLASSKPARSAPMKYQMVWGEILPVIFREGAFAISASSQALSVTAPAKIETAQWPNLLGEWQRREVLEKAPPVVEEWRKKLNLPPVQLHVRKLSRSWGNCRPKSREITLAARLAAMPPACLEYIIVHELCHLHIPNHGKAFKAMITTHCPHWRDLDKILAGN